MHIVFIGRDRQGADPTSPLAQRWRGLVRQGVSLTVILLTASGSSWEEPGIRVICAKSRLFPIRWMKALYIGSFVKRVDLVSGQDPAELGLLAYFIGKKISSRVEVQDHGGWFDGSPWIDEPFWRFRKWIADRLLSRVDMIRTVNPKSFQYLSLLLGKRVYFLPIACADHFFQVQWKPMKGHVVCVARFVPVKRHALLLQSFAVLHKMRPDMHLSLIGSGPLEGALRQLTLSLDLQDVVTFIHTQNAASILETAEKFVLLSSHEGWGVAAVEAAAVGVPVVMTDTGCASWLEERGLARIVRNLDPSGIAHALTEEWQQGSSKVGIPGLEEMQSEQVAQWKRCIR